MAKYYSGIDTSVGVGTETLNGMLANGSDFGVLPSKDIDCANINASGIHTVGGFFYPNGGIKDSSNSTGTSGKVLSSTGSGLAWIDPSEGSTANAVNVGTNENSTNADQFVAFMGASSGNNPVRVDTDLKYNPSTNVLSVKGITLPGDDQKISIGADNPLEIQHSSISSQVEIKSDANISIMSGDMVQIENESGGNIADFIKASGCKLYHNVSGTSTLRLETTNDGVTMTGTVSATAFSGSGENLTGLTASQIPNLAASNITSGTLSADRIPDLAASKITSGAIDDARLTSSSLFVTGMILLWSGAASAIPTGWVLCDGNSNTPDLRDKFVVGASNSTGDTTYPGLSPNATGGAATDTVNISDSASVVFGANGTGTASKAGSSSATVSISDSDTVNTLPPYYALCYIMKT